MGPDIYTFVDTPDGVSRLISAIRLVWPIRDLLTRPPSLYIDLEGINLGRNGTISILQIHLRDGRHTYLLDVHTLGALAFTTAQRGLTLKYILESPSVPKAIFDVRNDSAALWAQFGIRLACVQDLQLMELAARSGPRRYVCSLSNCIELDTPFSYAEKAAWKAAKQAGRRLFDPTVGGSYDVFNQRPLRSEVLQYCVRDVEYLPYLWDKYDDRFRARPEWRDRVISASEERVAASLRADYNGQSESKTLAPRGWEDL